MTPIFQKVIPTGKCTSNRTRPENVLHAKEPESPQRRKEAKVNNPIEAAAREIEEALAVHGFHGAIAAILRKHFAARAERDAENERLKARIAWLERPGAVRIGEQA